MVELFAVLSGLILLAGAPPYLIDILKGRTKPERATWLIWSLLGLLAFGSLVKLGAHWSLVFAGLDALGSLAVFGLSLRYGVGGWTRLDRLAILIALGGLSLALVTKQPLIALYGVVLADISGAILTIRKTYLAPESETAITWFLIGSSALLGALSVGKWQYNLVLYPLYLAISNYAVLLAIYSGRYFKKRLKV